MTKYYSEYAYDDDVSPLGDFFSDPDVRSGSVGVGTTVGNASLYARCTQRTYWTDWAGVTRKITELTPVHRRNLINWLERRATEIHRAAFESQRLSYEETLEDAVEWLNTLPLLESLRGLTYCKSCGHATSLLDCGV